MIDIEWHYPLDMNKLADNGDVVYGQYKNAGVSDVRPVTHQGECFDRISKTITI